MINSENLRQEKATCTSFAKGFGQKFMYFAIGSGIGAAVALLFAPKSGKELRQDITELAEDQYGRLAEAADQLKHQTGEYYRTAKESGSGILDLARKRASTVKEEVREDVQKIGGIVETARKHATEIEFPANIA